MSCHRRKVLSLPCVLPQASGCTQLPLTHASTLPHCSARTHHVCNGVIAQGAQPEAWDTCRRRLLLSLACSRGHRELSTLQCDAGNIDTPADKQKAGMPAWGLLLSLACHGGAAVTLRSEKVPSLLWILLSQTH